MKKKTKLLAGTAILGAGTIMYPFIKNAYEKSNNKKTKMKDFMKIVNEVYGVPLNGISSLKDSRVSLYAKGQWILQNKTDLFVVYTSNDNKEIKIYPTTYFTEKTGLTIIPVELQESLCLLGMSYNEDDCSFYYSHPNGEPISDFFIGKTLKAVTTVIQNSYAIL